MPKKSGKPKGKITAYAAFVQICREEHKKKHPDEQLVFAEFSKKCAEKWKTMGPKEKKRFEDIAERDKQRYEKELALMPSGQGATTAKKRGKKDPNAPKRPLSAFFFFCQEFRSVIKKQNPSYGIGEISKLLGHQWETIGDKSKYESQAAKDKARYEKDMAAYKSGGGGAVASAAKKTSAPVYAVNATEEDDEDDDEEDDEEDEESD